MEQARIPQRYKLIEEVGQGGMAVVYRATDETLKREVAIKLLHQHLAAEPESKARLEREAQAVAKLRHENILEIFDYSGSESASSYIVTEFIDGQTLKQFLATHTPGFPEMAALIAVEVCAALAHAHSVGVLHRDVKPENVMIRKDGLIKLTDFGIAQVLDLQRMTVTGQLLGSPAYMAPELIEGKPLDFRTDVFSVGIMLYLLATGALPFQGKNPHEVLRRISEGRFVDPRAAGRRVDETLARIITRALARRPDDRFSDVGPLADELRAYLAEAGLEDVRAELRGYFADPPGYEEKLRPRLGAALIGSAQRRLQSRQTAQAMELWNRVLAFDPDNTSVATAVRKLEGRTRLRKVGLGLLAGGALVGAGLALLGGRPHPPAESARAPIAVATPASPLPPSTAAAPAPAPVEAPAPTAVADDAPAAAAPVSRRRTAPRPPRVVAQAAPPEAAAVAPPRTFKLGPTPQNVDVYLDGQRQFGYDVDHTTISVPWSGVHVIEFRSTSGCCFVERVEVGPERPLPPDAIIARRLKWRPAHLAIGLEPASASARVMIRDPGRGSAATVARPGEEVDVPFLVDDDPSKEIEISVDTGDSFVTERLRIRAGQRLKHVVKLKAGAN
jgi:tRNA A-37 threonylcarbamoyl transferase component Bud32